MGPFDFIKAINESKDIMKNDPLAEKEKTYLAKC